MMLLLVLLLQVAQPAPVASPSTPPPLHGGPQQMTCPVGGERFPAWQASMYSTYGERPDGKPYSYLPFPFPVPECPGNKLIAFDKFSEAEKAALANIIVTIEYKRLIETDTTYYRAYWLANKLGRPKSQALGLLLSAIWQVSPGKMSEAATDKNRAQLARYQSTFVSEVRHLSPSVDAKDRIWLEARAANAARQMMHFDEAERLRKQAVKSLAGVTEKRGWDTYLATLHDVITRNDASVEPLDMIPEQQVAFTCINQRPSNAFDRATCAKPTVAARIAELRKSRP